MTEENGELSRRVLELRRAGVTVELIAGQLSLDVRAVRALLDAALGSYEPGYTLALEADRLDRLHLAVWPAAARGDVDAIDRVLKISERRDKVLAEPTPNAHELRVAFDASVETSAHVTQVDHALVEAGRKIADRVDSAVASGEGQEVTKALYLLPHMVNVLRELLATPASRQAAGLVATEPKDGKLGKLRALHQGQTG